MWIPFLMYQDSEGAVIPVSKVCELLIKVHNILDNAVSKWVGKLACISAHAFNSASRQHCEVWASQLPILHHLKDMVPPKEACLYGHIHWSLAQAQQQSSMGLFQSFAPMRGGKARPRTGFYVNVQKRLVLESSGASLAKRPHVEKRAEACLGGSKSTDGGVSASFTDSGK